MKSEHRHELAENDLSKILGRWIEDFDRHSNVILSGVVVLALIAAGVIYWTRSTRVQRESGWTELAASANPEDYANVADAYSGTPVADWARLRAANGFLQEGIRLSLTDRPASNDRLKQARTEFEALTAAGTAAPIREQALNGLAVTLESLSDGDTEPAIAAYQKLLDEFPETRFKEWATERIAALKSGRVQEFYAWFRKQNPEPAPIPVPRDQTGAAGGSLESLLPGLSGAGLPGGDSGSAFDELPLSRPADDPSDSSPVSERETPAAEQTVEGEDAGQQEAPAADGDATQGGEAAAPAETPAEPPATEQPESPTEPTAPETPSE